MPILYLSQVLGLALGLSAADVMLSKNVVDPAPLVTAAIEKAAALKAEEERKAAEKAAKAAAREKAGAATAGSRPAPPSRPTRRCSHEDRSLRLPLR